MSYYKFIDDLSGVPYGKEITITLEAIGNDGEKRQFVCNDVLLENLVEARLAVTEALKSEEWKIVDGTGIPQFRNHDGTINESWTFEEVCRFVDAVYQLSIDAQHAFFVYVNSVGTDWNEETFDEIYLGNAWDLEEFARDYSEDHFGTMMIPDFILDLVNWEGVWKILEKERGLYAVKLHEGDYLIMKHLTHIIPKKVKRA